MRKKVYTNFLDPSDSFCCHKGGEKKRGQERQYLLEREGLLGISNCKRPEARELPRPCQKQLGFINLEIVPGKIKVFVTFSIKRNKLFIKYVKVY